MKSFKLRYYFFFKVAKWKNEGNSHGGDLQGRKIYLRYVRVNCRSRMKIYDPWESNSYEQFARSFFVRNIGQSRRSYLHLQMNIISHHIWNHFCSINISKLLPKFFFSFQSLHIWACKDPLVSNSLVFVVVFHFEKKFSF